MLRTEPMLLVGILMLAGSMAYVAWALWCSSKDITVSCETWNRGYYEGYRQIARRVDPAWTPEQVEDYMQGRRAGWNAKVVETLRHRTEARSKRHAKSL